MRRSSFRRGIDGAWRLTVMALLGILGAARPPTATDVPCRPGSIYGHFHAMLRIGETGPHYKRVFAELAGAALLSAAILQAPSKNRIKR